MRKTKILIVIVLSIAVLATAASFSVPVSAADVTIYAPENEWWETPFELESVGTGDNQITFPYGGFWSGSLSGMVTLVEENDYSPYAESTMVLPEGKLLKGIEFCSIWNSTQIVDIKLSCEGFPDVNYKLIGDHPDDGPGYLLNTNWEGSGAREVTVVVASPNGSYLFRAGAIRSWVIGDDDGSTKTPTTRKPTETATIEPTTTEETTNTTKTTEHGDCEKGDINGDGKVNGMDLLLMKQHILDVPGKKIDEGTSVFYAADMNDDDKINGMDLLLLKKKILG